MSLEAVKHYFEQWGMSNRVIELDDSSATVEKAALALGCEAERIAKTMAFETKEEILVIVLAGDVRVDNRKFKDYFNVKASMIKAKDLVGKVGHPMGGVCPFALNQGVNIYLDESLKRFSSVFPACGSPQSAIELSMNELEKYTNYKSWIDVGKPL